MKQKRQKCPKSLWVILNRDGGIESVDLHKPNKDEYGVDWFEGDTVRQYRIVPKREERK